MGFWENLWISVRATGKRQKMRQLAEAKLKKKFVKQQISLMEFENQFKQINTLYADRQRPR